MGISRVYRLLRLITILQSGRSCTADQLAEELEVSRRTVFRDLNMLEMAHIPYYFDKDKGGYSIARHFFLPPVNLTLAEAVREYVGDAIGRLSLNIGPLARYEGLDSVFTELSEAVVGRKVCKLIYISFYDRKQLSLTAHPLRLAFINRSWYLIAYVPRYRQPRTFKLGRIKKLSVASRTFQPPKRFNLDDYFGDAWGMIPEGSIHNVHVRFAPKVAGNVAEVHWHHSQRVKWNDDGSIDFRAKVDGLGEIIWWILGYGDQAEVIAPAVLRNRLTKVAKTMADTYCHGLRKGS